VTVAKDVAVLAVTTAGTSSAGVLAIIRAAGDLAGATAQAPVVVGESTLSSVLDEAQVLHDKLIAVLNSAAQMIP